MENVFKFIIIMRIEELRMKNTYTSTLMIDYFTSISSAMNKINEQKFMMMIMMMMKEMRKDY